MIQSECNLELERGSINKKYLLLLNFLFSLFVCLFNLISPKDNCFCLFQGPCTLELERGSINQKRQNAQQSERRRRALELISQSHF